MSKLERMKKQAEIAKKERITHAQDQIKEAGLEFVDHELPPDEVDEKEVKRTLLTSIRTFIPYTNEWYEAKAAEEEMDDLRKIRIEKVKAADLYTLTKIGRHEEALDSMMAETNNDFFFFNKLKFKMENEGKWKFEFKNGSLASAGNRNMHRNRLRKAVNAVYGAMDEEMTNELARLTNAEGTGAKRYDRGGPCNWRGKNKEGEALKCENKRMERPPRSDAPPRRKNDPPDILACCCYHTPFCVSETHEPKEEVKIKVPNEAAYCSECFMMNRGRRPPPFTATIVPGVVPSAMVKLSVTPAVIKGGHADASAGAESSGHKAHKNRNRCTWIPNPDNVRARGYECCNDKYVNPITNEKINTCAWHTLVCLRDHSSGSSAVVTVPNEFGLCAQHYLAERGHPVVAHAFPLPGMQIKLAKDHWKGKRHFAAPTDAPPPVIVVKEYEEPEGPADFTGSLLHAVKMAMFNRRKRLLGKQMALRIQSWFRGCRSRNIHVDMKYMRAKYKRLLAVGKIQALARRYFGRCRVHAMRLLYNASARHIQRTYRGFKCRQRLRIDWAARRIAKFMKTLHFFKFKDAVIMIMQLRRMFKKRMTITILIQRVYRGYAGRQYVHRKRYWNLISRSYAQRIQRNYRKYLIRKRMVPWNPPGEEWVLKQCAKKLSRMLLEMYLDRSRRRDLAQLMLHSAPEMQRLVRGFLGRAGTQKMKFLRHAMRNWIAPRLAGEFMETYLNSKIFYLNSCPLAIVAVEKLETGVLHIRKFLSEDKRNRFETDFRSFDPAIEAWYKSENMILLKSEKDALLRKFRNPMNGNVQIKPLDEFITAHKYPCRKHGRFVCGDCVYRKNCQLANCRCTLFKSSTHDGHGICVNCDHPGSLHSLCPKQMRKSGNNRGPSMLSIVTAAREPDMSFPMNVEGVASEAVIIPPVTADDKRAAHTAALVKQRKLDATHPATVDRSLSKSLALCEIDGDTVHSNDKYWNVTALSAVTPIEHTEDKSDTAIFDPVMFDSRAPDYHVTPSVFWSLTAKNPNKTVRDYNEKFDHNMPVPVVRNDEIVYSFEGPQIYFNLINQIIRLDDKVYYDDPEFLKLVVDHIQLFERHWRKMVADIRTGKLDRNLQIDAESRMIFESANIPKPALAKRLDDTFRKLGFHKKVLGKDIQIVPYAKKKRIGVFAQAKPKRKVSLPTNALSGQLRPLSSTNAPQVATGTKLGAGAGNDINAALAQVRAQFGMELPDIDSPKKKVTMSPLGGDENHRALARTGSSSTGQLKRTGTSPSASPLKRTGSSPTAPKLARTRTSPTKDFGEVGRSALFGMGQSTMSLTALGRNEGSAEKDASPNRPTNKRERLAALSQSFRLGSAGADSRPDTGFSAGSSNNSPSRPGTRDSAATPNRKRRGSHSDTHARPITAHDLDAVHYSLDTAARENYKHTIKTDGDRFICPFPACGKSFHSMDAAFRHLPVHEQRTRLFAPTPLQDSHLAFYWPTGVPWLENEKYAERAIPPGALPCTAPGCKEVFPNQMHLDAHLRLIHRIVSNSSLSHGYFRMIGDPKYVPPDRPPEYVPLRWCPLHSLPLGSCTTCVEIDASKGPKQPFRFHRGVNINFSLKRRLKLGAPNSFMNVDVENGEVEFHSSESHIGVVVVSRKKSGVRDDYSEETPPQPMRPLRLGSISNISASTKNNNAKLRRTDSNLSLTRASILNANNNTSFVVHEWRGRPVAMMTDRNENGWVAVEVLFTHQEALAKGLFIPPGFHKRHQLLRPLRPFVVIEPNNEINLSELEIYDTAAEHEFERFIKWVPMHAIDRTFTLDLCLSQEEVDQTITTTGSIGLRNRFFVAHGDVEY